MPKEDSIFKQILWIGQEILCCAWCNSFVTLKKGFSRMVTSVYFPCVLELAKAVLFTNNFFCMYMYYHDINFLNVVFFNFSPINFYKKGIKQFIIHNVFYLFSLN